MAMGVGENLDQLVAAIETGRLVEAADGARCTINGQRATTTDLRGLTGTVEAQPALIDAASGTGVVFITVRHADQERPLVVGLRIGTDGDRLTELEVLRSADGESSIFAPERVVAQRNAVMDDPLDGAGDRDAIVAGADRYFTDLAANTATSRFRTNCQRIENGFQTTGNPAVLGGSTCHQQMAEGWFSYIEAVRGRRYPVVDPTTGVVLAVAFLDVPGTVSHLELTNGNRIELPERMRQPRSTLLFEQFKVDAGELVWIEAIMVNLAYGSPHGWEASTA